MDLVKEIEVFLPFHAEMPPTRTAQSLIEALNVGRATVGEDLLTGAITIRIAFTTSLWDGAQSYFRDSTVPYELRLS